MKEINGTFIFDGDTKRMHRFFVKNQEGITGTIYVPKDNESIPTRIILDYQRPGESGKDA
jgi:hypothetical protein